MGLQQDRRHVSAGGRSRCGGPVARDGVVRAACAVLVDTDDDACWMRAAADAHRPGVGRIVVHPTPGASHAPALAQDLLNALGKCLPRRELGVPRHRAGWADMVHPAWRAVACWINAHRVGHLVVVRAHALTPVRWAQLADLQRCTGVCLSLVWHGAAGHRVDEHAGALTRPYVVIDEQEMAWRRLRWRGVRSDVVVGACQEGAGVEAASGAVIGAVRRVGHPLHAGLLATQLVCRVNDPHRLAGVRLGDLAPDGTGLALPHVGAGRWSYARTWQPVTAWARPLLIAARAWHHHGGHRHGSWRLFQHDNFHHHNQLIALGAELGIEAAVEHLDGDPAWPKNHD